MKTALNACVLSALAGVAAASTAQVDLRISASQTRIDPGESVTFTVSATAPLGIMSYGLQMLPEMTGDVAVTYSDLDASLAGSLMGPLVTAPFDGGFVDGQSGAPAAGRGANPLLFGATSAPDLTMGGLNPDLFSFVMTADKSIREGGTISFGTEAADGFDASGVLGFKYPSAFAGLFWLSASYLDVSVTSDEVVVAPTPGVAALMGLAGMTASRRRR